MSKKIMIEGIEYTIEEIGEAYKKSGGSFKNTYKEYINSLEKTYGIEIFKDTELKVGDTFIAYAKSSDPWWLVTDKFEVIQKEEGFNILCIDENIFNEKYEVFLQIEQFKTLKGLNKQINKLWYVEVL